MKEFQSLRTELNEGIEDLQEHIAIANSSMPPNILILRRKTVRQFPNNTMVALYYNDKLGQYFSIPYGGDVPGVVTPVALKEQTSQEKEVERHDKTAAKWDKRKKRWGDWKDSKKHWKNVLHVPRTPYQGSTDVLKEEHRPGDTVRYISGSNAHLKVGRVVEVKPDYVTVHRKGLHGQYGYHYKVAHNNIVHNDRTGRISSSDLKESEQIQELSKGMLGSYIRGAARNKDLLMVKSSNARMTDQTEKANELQDKSFKRTKGIRTAAEKLVNKGPRSLEEGAIEHLKHVRSFGTGKPLRHADGTQTRIDPTTAHALLTVHDALKPEHQVKFVQHLEHSKPKFHKMLDFAWSQVK